MPNSLKKVLHLGKNDRIVTAYAQRSFGPGWSNSLIWVIVRNKEGYLREECIQPEERTAGLHWLYDVSAAAHASLMDALRSAIEARR